MKSLLIFVFLSCFGYLDSACLPSITTVSGTNAPSSFCSGDVIFEDNFDSLELAKWKHEITLGGGGNWEFQWYVNNRSNSYAENGNLHLKPTLTSEIYGEDFLTKNRVIIPPEQCTQSNWYGCDRQGTVDHIINPIQSARVSTWDSFRFKYGMLEIRAKMPAGDWLWPALWLMPRDSTYGSWPASGEIDVMEGRGNREMFDGETNVGVKQGGVTLHYGPRWDVNGWSKAHASKNKDEGFNNDFHLYKFLWTPIGLKFWYDDDQVLNVPVGEGFWKRGDFGTSGLPNPWLKGSPTAPFDQEFYIIMNLATGGTNNYFGDSWTNKPHPKPW